MKGFDRSEGPRGRHEAELSGGVTRLPRVRPLYDSSRESCTADKNDLLDLLSLRWARLNDSVLEFARAGGPAPPGTSARPGT